MRVIVCGGRTYADAAHVDTVLAGLRPPVSLVRHGAARGADALADAWARAKGIALDPMPADWDKLGRLAGPSRNAAMAARGADLCVAFPGGKGTRDMIRKAYEAGIPVLLVPPPSREKTH